MLQLGCSCVMPVCALADGHKHKAAFEYSAVIAYCSGAAFARINNYTGEACIIYVTDRAAHWPYRVQRPLHALHHLKRS